MEEDTRVYESWTLGMPALKMVLVHARNDVQNTVEDAPSVPQEPEVESPAILDTESAVRRIIRHLESSD
jgi:hypothetical protein